MSKQGNTKERIVRLISEGKNNLTQISETLNLAPSTVSKHLRDLETSGRIEQKSNSHVKKWKYYQLTSTVRSFAKEGPRLNNIFITTAVAIAIIAAVAFSYLHVQNTNSIYVPISITDPPQVPSGTQALYINYSSLEVHAGYKSDSEWIQLNSSGRINLMSLINETQVIGGADIRIGSSIDTIQFNITSASITINNITYAVQLPKKQITATIDDPKSIGTYSNILLDFFPVVTPVYTQNSTTFVLLPSIKALFVSDRELSQQAPNSNAPHMTYPLQQRYREMFSNKNISVVIKNVTLQMHDNITTLRVELNNDGIANITVIGLALYGNVTPYSMSGAPGSDNNTFNWSRKLSAGDFLNQSNSSISINVSSLCSMGMYLNANTINMRLKRPVYDVSISGFRAGVNPGNPFGMAGGFFPVHPEGIIFIVNRNGSLSLPLSSPIPEGMPFQGPEKNIAHQKATLQEPGYLMLPNSTFVFSYTGELKMGDSRIAAELSSGSQYQVMVITDGGMVQTITNMTLH